MTRTKDEALKLAIQSLESCSGVPHWPAICATIVTIKQSLAAQPAAQPVAGDLLPPIGSRVLIHLASRDSWVEHTVVGYYVWGTFESTSLHRVFVRVRSSDGILNARSLCDVRPIEAAHGITEKGQQ
jgi:hypothetical protein